LLRRHVAGERIADGGVEMGLLDRASAPPVVRKRDTKKGAAVAGGSKVKQGGVKQSGQEPLDVQ